MVWKAASTLWSLPLKACIHWSLFINPIFLLYEQWGLNSINTKTHSCYAAKLRGRQQTKPVRPKTFTWFSPPPTLQKKKKKKGECKQKETTRQEEHQLGENLRVWERTGRGGRKGKGRLFLSAQSVYITKEESLEYKRAVSGATALQALSCCQSAPVLSRTVRDVKVSSLAWGLQ